ncbi:MAG: DUF2283 domain-containing protein [Chloroflexi bacterium]|nr:DUF2283 domain-containing protein [Chloroflexota bacterium]
MKITYDSAVDAAYIYFKKGRGEVTTVILSEDIAVDFGPGEEIWGIEILDDSKHFAVSKKRGKPRIQLVNVEALSE